MNRILLLGFIVVSVILFLIIAIEKSLFAALVSLAMWIIIAVTYYDRYRMEKKYREKKPQER